MSRSPRPYARRDQGYLIKCWLERIVFLNKKDNKKKIRYILAFMISCAVIIGTYMYLAGLNKYVLTYALMIAYISVFLILVFTYVIYNRGILGKRLTPDMLDPQIPYEERVEMVEDVNRRRDKSSWMIPVAVPFLLSFLLDYIGVQEIFKNICNLF